MKRKYQKNSCFQEKEIASKGLERKKSSLEAINKKIDEMALNMEKFKMIDYVYYIENPRKMFLANFIGGVSRGFGLAVGFTLLGAVIIYFLQIVVMWNLPVIGSFISEIVKIVQENLMSTGGKLRG